MSQGCCGGALSAVLYKAQEEPGPSGTCHALTTEASGSKASEAHKSPNWKLRKDLRLCKVELREGMPMVELAMKKKQRLEPDGLLISRGHSQCLSVSPHGSEHGAGLGVEQGVWALEPCPRTTAL